MPDGAHSSQGGDTARLTQPSGANDIKFHRTNTFYTMTLSLCSKLETSAATSCTKYCERLSSCRQPSCFEYQLHYLHKEVCIERYLWPNPHDARRPNIYWLLRLHAASKSLAKCNKEGQLNNVFCRKRWLVCGGSLSLFQRAAQECCVIDSIKNTLCIANLLSVKF